MITDVFQQDIILEDERAILRPLAETDFDGLLPYSLNEPDIWKYGQITAAGEENLRNYISSAVKNRLERKEYPFVVFDKKANKYAGSTRFYDIQQPWLSTQLGYTWYGQDFQRSGLNRHCKLLLLTFIFETWGLERLEFRAHAANHRSIDAMKAIGCVMEGTLRSQLPVIDGTRRDTVVLSIIKKEWFGGVKDLLTKKTH